MTCSIPQRTRLAAAMLLGLTAMLCAPVGFAATTIYRTVDESGNVVFTDVPPTGGEREEAVNLNQGNSYSPPEQHAGDGARTVDEWLRDRENGDTGGGDRAAGSTGYDSVSIAAPANDATIRDNAGNVPVAAEVQPGLHEGDALQVFLDGVLRQSVTGTMAQLTNVDRGTHVVEVRIVNAAGNTVAGSQPVTFHLQRRSVLLQPAPGH